MSLNQGKLEVVKLEVVKQEMARVNVDILGISKLRWTEWVNLTQMTITSITVGKNTLGFPSQPEGKIGLPRANPRGRLRSPS